MYSVDVQYRPTDETAASVIAGYFDGVTVLGLVGEHDMSTAEEVEFNIARGRGIVISLTDTQFLDSSILRVLFKGDREMLQIGRRLVLHMKGNESILRPLELACADERLLCCDSLEEAIAFASQPFS